MPGSPPSPARVVTTPPGPIQQTLRTVRVTWRHEVHRRWREWRPVALLALGLVALVLGTIGYLQLKSATPRYDFLDSLYRAITLFVFGGAAIPPVPTTLEIARILAPVLTGYAAIGTVLALSREQARVLGIRMFVRHHVIIAGLGEAGSRLALALVDREPVVVIESNPLCELLPAARARGVRVLIGPATDELMLRRAGIKSARTVVALCGRDGTNVDVAAAATKARETDARLTIFAHLRDLDLWRSLAAEGATFESRRSEVRLEYFNMLATGAQLLLESHPPLRPPPDEAARWRPHILMVGLDGVGEQIVLQIARQWRSLARGSSDELRMTLTGPDADHDLARLRERYPALDRYCVLVANSLAIESARFQAGEAMIGTDGRCDVSHAFVCLGDEADGLLAALALHARPGSGGVPVTVALDDAAAGIAIALASEEGRFAGISSYGVLSAATSDELLLRGTNELLARAQHAQWLRNEENKGVTVAENPFLKPWEELDESQREDNRKFADDLHTKLSLVGAMLVPMPLRDPTQPPFAFTDPELDLLSRREHERWVNARRGAGWRYGPATDRQRKISADIKPWEELDEPGRDKDRNAVRELPDMLAMAGFRIERTNMTNGAL
jgi:TrkA-N domain/RyR domain